MPDVRNDPAIFQEFQNALGTRDPKTIAAYLSTMRDYVFTSQRAAWLRQQGRADHLSERALSILGCN